MILSSCAALISGVLVGCVAFASLLFMPNISEVLQKLRSLEIKAAFTESPLLPITVPAFAVLALIISISITKELKVNDTTLVTFQKCDSKIETKVATIKVPGCLVALR